MKLISLPIRPSYYAELLSTKLVPGIPFQIAVRATLDANFGQHMSIDAAMDKFPLTLPESQTGYLDQVGHRNYTMTQDFVKHYNMLVPVALELNTRFAYRVVRKKVALVQHHSDYKKTKETLMVLETTAAVEVDGKIDTVTFLVFLTIIQTGPSTGNKPWYEPIETGFQPRPPMWGHYLNSTLPVRDRDSAVKALTYCIQDGDTLSQIAEFFGTTAGILAEVNNIENMNLIHPGVVITVADDYVIPARFLKVFINK